MKTKDDVDRHTDGHYGCPYPAVSVPDGIRDLINARGIPLTPCVSATSGNALYLVDGVIYQPCVHDEPQDLSQRLGRLHWAFGTYDVRQYRAMASDSPGHQQFIALLNQIPATLREQYSDALGDRLRPASKLSYRERIERYHALDKANADAHWRIRDADELKQIDAEYWRQRRALDEEFRQVVEQPEEEQGK